MAKLLATYVLTFTDWSGAGLAFQSHLRKAFFFETIEPYNVCTYSAVLVIAGYVIRYVSGSAMSHVNIGHTPGPRLTCVSMISRTPALLSLTRWR